MRRFLLPLLLIAHTAAAAAPPAVPLYKTFGRWIIACDNVRHCEARGFDEGPRADLRITRDAGTAAPAAIFSWDPLPDRATLRLDGQKLDLPAPAWSASTQDQTLATSDPASITALVAALKDAKSITFGTGDDAGTIPLQGFVAALLLMDAVQGRPGTPTALMAPRGNNGVDGAPGLPRKPAWHPATALTTAETATVIEKAQRSEAFRDQNKDAVCTSQGVPLPPPEAFALQPDRALVLEQCGLAPYNQGIIAIITPRDDKAPEPFKANLPLLGGEEGTVNGSLFNGGFDPKTGTLSTAYRRRALSDCGYSGRWIWSNGAFRLSEFAMLGPCGGAKLGDWPTLYRTAP